MCFSSFTFSAIIGVAYWAETTLDREFTVSSDGTGAVLGSNATFETFVNAQRIRYKKKTRLTRIACYSGLSQHFLILGSWLLAIVSIM